MTCAKTSVKRRLHARRGVESRSGGAPPRPAQHPLSKTATRRARGEPATRRAGTPAPHFGALHRAASRFGTPILRAAWVMEPECEERPHVPLRLWIFSDLDVDRFPIALPDPLPAFDALIVAGNLAAGLETSLQWLATALAGRHQGRPVIYVPGNRDFWTDAPMGETLRRGRALAAELGFQVLSDDVARIEDDGGSAVHVVGATLWTDWRINGPRTASVARGFARHYWDDRKRIPRRPGQWLAPHDAAGFHARSRAYIEDVLASIVVQRSGFGRSPVALVDDVGPGDRAVVVTSHAPSRRCLPASLAKMACDEWLASFFASDLDDVMDCWGAPSLWVHGRVPRFVDIRLGKSRVVANPGHLGTQPSQFDMNFVVEV